MLCLCSGNLCTTRSLNWERQEICDWCVQTTEEISQSCSIIGIGRHLWKSSRPMLKLRSTTVGFPGCVQPGFEYVQDCTMSLGSLFNPLIFHTVKNFYVCRELPILPFVPAALSCHWALLRRACLHLLYILPTDIYMHNDNVPLNLLQAEHSQPFQLLLVWEVLQSFLCLTHSSMSISLLCWWAKHFSKLSRCDSPMLNKEEGWPAWICWW